MIYYLQNSGKQHIELRLGNQDIVLSCDSERIVTTKILFSETKSILRVTAQMPINVQWKILVKNATF